MPIYEYVCPRCSERFDRLQRSSDPDPACPGCGATEVRRLISVIAGLTGSGLTGSGSGFTASGSTGSGRAGGCGCGGACACGR